MSVTTNVSRRRREQGGLRWAIVGIGAHADVRMAPAVAATSGAHLTAVWSRDRGRAEAFARRHGVPRAYDSYAALLAAPDVDVVYVATPNALHCEQTIQAAEAGKHVLCEKPMTLSAGDAAAMIEACDRAGVKLGVAFQNRQHPAHQRIQALVASGAAGEVRLAMAQYSHDLPADFRWPGWRASAAMAGGGSLMGMGAHALDLLRFVLGREVEEATAYSDEDPASGQVDRSVACLLRLRGGACAVAVSSVHVPHAHNDLVVHGSRLRLEAQGTIGVRWQGQLAVTGETEAHRQAGPALSPSWQARLGAPIGTETTVSTFPCDAPVTALYARLVEDFNASIEEDREPLATGHDGLAMVELVDAILRSSRERRSIPVSLGAEPASRR